MIAILRAIGRSALLAKYAKQDKKRIAKMEQAEDDLITARVYQELEDMRIAVEAVFNRAIEQGSTVIEVNEYLWICLCYQAEFVVALNDSQRELLADGSFRGIAIRRYSDE